MSSEFVFLTGSSGAGKSTLMKLLYREEVPSSGTVMIGNINIAKLPNDKVPNIRRCMGIVFQDYKLLQNISVYDNIALVIRTLGMRSKEIQDRVKGALKVVGLLNKMNAKPYELSGGEQQRVSIARAIVNGPPLLLADEPTGNLDPNNSMEIMQILEQINEKGITVIVSTHDRDIVDHFRKRVITLENGQIVRDVQAGTYE
jgi:cell division transport system ATP-binding protein